MKVETVSNMPHQDAMEELKAYVEGVLGGKIVTENMGYCGKCGKWEDLRFGVCFDCAFPLCPFQLGDCDFKHLGYGINHEVIVYTDQYVDREGKTHCEGELCNRAKSVIV